ncbi:MAG TPA: hypothetical protein VMA53_13040 [Stellaceae bacterium]|nr:hypothetical protein [Stellaceae bacterium]
MSARRGVTFEVRKYAEGRWLIDSIFDDQSLAVQEAEYLVNTFKTLMAVRVIAVSEGDGEYREWPIFKYENGKTTRSAPRPEERRIKASVAPPANQTRDFEKRGGAERAAPRRRSFDWVYYARLTFGMIVVIGAAILGVALLRSIS